MFKLSPSLLAADFSELAKELRKVEQAGSPYIHLDVMDGVFVPNISFGAPVIADLRKVTSMCFDVHLMITNPIRYLDDFVKAGADIITVHYESCEDIASVIHAIRKKGVRASLAIKPNTPAEVVYPLLSELDMVLVMTVEPGFGGQKMIPETLQKVKEIRTYAQSHDLELDIEVDGGISPDNLDQVIQAGANVVVAGSAVFKASDPAAVVARMAEIAENASHN